jgi:hypothetical protein
MSSPWIESHVDLANHPKLYVLTESLGIRKRDAIGILHLLWWFAGQYAGDGRLDKFSVTHIARACDWDGDPNPLIDALMTAGFMDRAPLRVHDWQEYRLHFDALQSKIDKKREKVRERVRSYRQRNASVTLHGNAAPSVTVTPLASVTVTPKSLHTDITDITDTTKKTNPSSEPAVREVIDYFHKKLTDHFGSKPVSFAGGALAAIVKRSLKTLTAGEVRARVDAYFLSTDPFIQRNGYSVNLFISKFDLLKGGPLHAQTSASGGAYIGAPTIASKYAKVEANRKNPQENRDPGGRHDVPA